MNSDAEAQRQQAVIKAKLDEVAAETGYNRVAVNWIYMTVIYSSQRPQPGGSPRRGLNGEELCATLIRDANEASPGGLRVVLEYHRLLRSEDVGAIFSSLVKHGLLVREEDDFFTDFDGVYTIENLSAFLASHGIRRRWAAPGVCRRLALALCAIGGSVILANWFHPETVPNRWLGPLVCAFGCLILSWIKFQTNPGTRQ